MRLLGSLFFSAAMMGSAVLFALLGLLSAPFSFRFRYRVITTWSRLNLWWLRWACGLRYEVEGREHIPSGSAIIFCKHQSAWETLALSQIFPPQVWVTKRELLWVPFFGWGLALLEPIAIDRKAGRRALEQLVREGRERLAAGRWVVVFPEGTRVAPGHQRRYRMGGAVLAEQSGYPVVPVAHNAGLFWPRRGFLKRPGVIRLVIGPAIDSRGRSAAEINALAEQWIEPKARELDA